ncbi:hypothetical protein SAMN04488063_2653 [Halopelagius inordinatus]|uniref:Uncharacterized protein n=1 Tax=Halopelagius inordinatus TaxID=553467 RepID=A0A1I2TDZ4_9EURY|nr:hypothetical protein [Halopelagius inordinatus]SFG63112.1 hypothetical protein SAMN04488063_2653 [Halopelagius inordinatus]
MNRRDGRSSRTLSRRRLLSISAVGAAGLAGCGGTNARNDDDGGEDGGGEESETDSERDSTSARTDEETSLGYVRVVNLHDQAHTMHVLVERRGEVAFWSSYRLGTDSDGTTRRVDGPWTENAESYTVHFRIDEREEWRTFATEKTDFPCYGLEGRIGADGQLGVWVEDTPGACETTTAED